MVTQPSIPYLIVRWPLWPKILGPWSYPANRRSRVRIRETGRYTDIFFRSFLGKINFPNFRPIILSLSSNETQPLSESIDISERGELDSGSNIKFTKTFGPIISILTQKQPSWLFSFQQQYQYSSLLRYQELRGRF